MMKKQTPSVRRWSVEPSKISLKLWRRMIARNHIQLVLSLFTYIFANDFCPFGVCYCGQRKKKFSEGFKMWFFSAIKIEIRDERMSPTTTLSRTQEIRIIFSLGALWVVFNDS